LGGAQVIRALPSLKELVPSSEISKLSPLTRPTSETVVIVAENQEESHFAPGHDLLGVSPAPFSLQVTLPGAFGRLNNSRLEGR